MTERDITADHPFQTWYSTHEAYYMPRYELARDAYVQGWKAAMETRPGCSGAKDSSRAEREQQQPGQTQGG